MQDHSGEHEGAERQGGEGDNVREKYARAREWWRWEGGKGGRKKKVGDRMDEIIVIRKMK